jgi:hypothetical protein
MGRRVKKGCNTKSEKKVIQLPPQRPQWIRNQLRRLNLFPKDSDQRIKRRTEKKREKGGGGNNNNKKKKKQESFSGVEGPSWILLGLDRDDPCKAPLAGIDPP